MLHLSARPVVITGAVMVLVLLLGCANYGVLLHKQIVPPPDIDIALGPYDLRSWVDYEPPCGAHPYCEGVRSKIFYMSLFISDPTMPTTPHIVQFVRLPLAST